MLDEVEGVVVLISIHALREEGDLVGLRVHRGGQISIHALREEGDTKSPHTSFWLSIFLSTPSARRATRRRSRARACVCYFYPRPPRGGRRSRRCRCCRSRPISIHALREEGDRPYRLLQQPGHHFYPRPPRGGRLHQKAGWQLPLYFYPRPPRGGRHRNAQLDGLQIYFYPRPPRGGRR